ncbi:class I SAM-dependent methyltransferase [Psychroserpens algicola]|uniref:class I SAM-dependent methyltransferase n=1 Tax=Psychroserpens algicola TaxID=1719034 RepID=UPI0019545979|nr:class I SAM-dependent methyltransferase [Psychroserpens algicola]
MKTILKRIKNKLFKKNKLTKKEQRHKLVGSAKSWKLKQDFQIAFLLNQGLKVDDKFLDLGCGTLRGGIPIINYLNEGHYYGIDVRKDVLVEGKKELKQEGLAHKNPKLISFDNFSELELNETFDVIFAFSVLIHLEDSILENCLHFVSRHLNSSGKFMANVNIGERPKGSWLEFPVMFKPIEFYEELAQKAGLSVTQMGTIKSLGHHSNDELSNNQIMLQFRKL